MRWHRILAVLRKELVQLRRDKLTFAMLIGVPLMQLVLFGYAINGDPRGLPMAVVAHDNSSLVRSIVRAAENTRYFKVVASPGESEAEAMLTSGTVQFVLVFPADFRSVCCVAKNQPWPSTLTPPTPQPPALRWLPCWPCRSLP